MIGLATLQHTTVRVHSHDAYPEKGQASIVLAFSDGTRLTTAYWRLVENGQATLSSFDHDQQYGLPAPIDAKAELAKALDGHTCIDAKLDEVTGDLLFGFDGNLRFQALNSSRPMRFGRLSFPTGPGSTRTTRWRISHEATSRTRTRLPSA